MLDIILASVVAFVVTYAINFNDIKYAVEVKMIVDECEQSLPRNENCKIIAVKDEK